MGIYSHMGVNVCRSHRPELEFPDHRYFGLPVTVTAWRS